MLEKSIINKFKEQDLKIHLFSAGWRATCLMFLPQIMRIISELDLGDKEVEIIEVAPGKKEPAEPIQLHKITRVPTLVVTKNSQEIGRITEYPNSTWEEDFSNIIKKA